MADVSEKELKEEIEKILKDADLAVMTTKKVILQLEKQYGAEIRKRKAVIDKMVLDYVDKMDADKSDEEEEEKQESASEESSEEEKPKPKRGGRAPPKPRAKKEKVTKEKKPGKKGAGTGFTRSYKLSPALAALMGADELPRHAVVKKIWAIVKENNLYDPNNKQFAICDDALYKVIGKQKFRVFGMMKYLKGHFLD